ncbi:MAG: MBL fold metallo-hydrolase, partial [Muribaculum sp.]|nr:MBL fold metallo-hydrolase [Candidatus Merdivivens faecigallinarum]
ILFDTGLGTRESLLEEGLAEAGVKPGDMDFLYLTHFHGDHIGGMMKGDSVAFPNAEVYASQAEYDAWMSMSYGRKAQVVKTMSAYSDRLHLFGFGDVLPGKVLAIGAVGHTPGHTAYQVGTYLIAGDFMHGAALQSAYPEYCASYDMDKAKAVEARKYLMDYARENNLVLAGMHLPEGIMR